MPKRVDVELGNNRTYTLGLALVGHLKNHKFVRIQWDGKRSCWICYLKNSTAPFSRKKKKEKKQT